MFRLGYSTANIDGIALDFSEKEGAIEAVEMRALRTVNKRRLSSAV